jgi:hypothetical protein
MEPDFRSDRMRSPEGKGRAKAKLDEYLKTAPPLKKSKVRYAAVRLTPELYGFWLMWHLEGGFEGLLSEGMSRSSIYRRIRAFRMIMGMHPDECKIAGVTLNLAQYQDEIRSKFS